jgi:hypothetical protein
MKQVKMMTALLLSLLLLAACSPSLEPKEALQEALTKQISLTSYEFEGEGQFSFQLPDELAEGDPTAAMIIGALKDSKLSWKGAYQQEPFQMEMTLNLATNVNGMSMNFEVPVLIDKEIVYFKIPILTQDQYVSMNLNELAEMSGETTNPFSAEEMKKSQELATKFQGIVLNSLPTELFNRGELTNEVTLPSGKVEDLVSVKITEKDIKPVLIKLIGEAGPQILDLLVEQKLMTAEEATEAKESINPDEINAAVDTFQESFKIHTFQLDTYLDDQGQIRVQDISLNADFSSEGQTGVMDIKITGKMNNLNGIPTFKLTVPAEGDTIPFLELMGQMGGGF